MAPVANQFSVIHFFRSKLVQVALATIRRRELDGFRAPQTKTIDLMPLCDTRHSKRNQKSDSARFRELKPKLNKNYEIYCINVVHFISILLYSIRTNDSSFYQIFYISLSCLKYEGCRF